MRVLITGQQGQLGAALAGELSHLGELLVTGRWELDLSRPETIAPFLDAHAPELIINAAAYTQVDKAESEPDLVFAVNEAAPYELAKWAKKQGVRLIHYSTDYVFDGSGTHFWREDDPTGPLGVYGASKLAGEDAIAAIGGPSLILRTSWVYSAAGPCFLTTMLKLGAERPALSIVNDQIGAPTSANWLAAMTAQILAAGNDAFDDAPQRYHIAPAGTCSWYDFADAIFANARNAGLRLAVETLTPIPSKDYPTPAQRPLNSRLDTTKFATRFGVKIPNWRSLLDDLFQGETLL
jgi:dTDP-4-dehydrorhamnose reductase